MNLHRNVVFAIAESFRFRGRPGKNGRAWEGGENRRRAGCPHPSKIVSHGMAWKGERQKTDVFCQGDFVPYGAKSPTLKYEMVKSRRRVGCPHPSESFPQKKGLEGASFRIVQAVHCSISFFPLEFLRFPCYNKRKTKGDSSYGTNRNGRRRYHQTGA